jgi:branched-subunit amino acid transport protein
MSATWWGVLGTSAIALLLKYLGHSVPEKYLAHPTVQRVNLLVPVALLSALVAIQTFTEGSRLLLDHRSAGIGVAVIALLLRAPFPIVVISSALTSALLYHFI